MLKWSFLWKKSQLKIIQLFTHILYVSLKQISYSLFSSLLMNKLSVLPPSLWSTASPPAADLLFRLPLIDVLQQRVSTGSVVDGGPGEDRAVVRPKITKKIVINIIIIYRKLHLMVKLHCVLSCQSLFSHHQFLSCGFLTVLYCFYLFIYQN